MNTFIFTPGIWIGEGKISFSASSEFIKFYTKWDVKKERKGVIKATQAVELQGADEILINTFTFYEMKENSFKVTLENNQVESVQGTGVRDEKTVAWEFKGHPECEGFEVYEMQENGDYFLHAEYGTPPHYRNTIEGLIWLKTNLEN